MEIVESCALFPGCCAITRSSTGPFVDTGRHGLGDERIYLQVAFVAELAELIGMRPEAEVEDERRRRVEGEEERERLRGVEREYWLLREAVVYTLLNGAIVDKDGTKRLRQKPGLERPELSESPVTLSASTSEKE